MLNAVVTFQVMEEPGAECEAKERARFQRGVHRWHGCAMAGGKEGWVVAARTPDVYRVRLVHSCRWSPQWVGGQKGSVSTCEWRLRCDANISVGILPHSVR